MVGPRHQPTLTSSLRNTRGRELLRIVDTAVPNLKHPKEFAVVLTALAIDGQWRRALRLLREMREVGITPGLEMYNGVLAAMAKDKTVDKALGMLVEMEEKCITPDVHSYNHCIGACKPAEWQRAIRILDELPELGAESNAISFQYAAAACEEAGEWQRSLALFMEIGSRNLPTENSVPFNYALSACRQGKQWQHGFEIMEEMGRLSYQPDFRLKLDLEAQSRGLDRAPPPEPSARSTPSPDNLWQRKQQLRELREQDKRRQEERRLEEERQERERKERDRRQRAEQGADAPPHTAAAAPPAAEAASREAAAPAAGQLPRQQQQQTAQAQPRPQEQRPAAGQQQGERERSSSAPQRPPPRSQEPRPAPSSRPRGESAAKAEKPVFVEESLRPPRDGQERFKEERRERPEGRRDGPRKPKLRSPGSYVLPVFAQHDRSNHAERQALIKVIARVQEASGAQTDEEFERECAEVTGTVRLYASHTPCISCMACFCQFQRLFPKVKLCVDFDDWRDTRRMVELARREEEHKRRGMQPPNYDCPGLSDMSDEEDCPPDMESAAQAAAAPPA